MLQRLTKIFLMFFFLILIGGLLHEGYIRIQGNFHAVKEGEVYRSAQLNKFNLAYYIKKKKIKSILNLRGANKNANWYKNELTISKKYNVLLINHNMSSRQFYNIKQIEEIINILKTAPKPLLIHCLGGADRTSFVSAIWRYAIKKEDAKEAEKSFKWLYGYLPFFKKGKGLNLHKSFLNFVEET